MFKIFNKLTEKLFPISPIVRIIAVQFCSPSAAVGKVDTENGEILFTFVHFGTFAESKIGEKTKDILLVVTQDGMAIENDRTNECKLLNFRERRLLQAAISEWIQMDNVSFEDMPRVTP